MPCTVWPVRSKPGWPDWANFRSLGDFGIFQNNSIVSHFWLLFPQKNSCQPSMYVILYKMRVGPHFGRLFQKSFWSPWSKRHLLGEKIAQTNLNVVQNLKLKFDTTFRTSKVFFRFFPILVFGTGNSN
jgi:hypothetical protein